MAKKCKETFEFTISLKFNVAYDDSKTRAVDIVDRLESDVLNLLAKTDFKRVKNVHADMRPVGRRDGWFKPKNGKRGKLGKLGKLGKTYDKFVVDAKAATD